MKGLLNLVVFTAAVGVLKWLCAVVGPQAYGTAAGNFKIAGILFLTAVVSALGVMILSAMLKVNDAEEQRQEFWLAGIMIPVGLAGTFWFLGRALLILVGIVAAGSEVPSWLDWLFKSLDSFRELGS